MKKSLFNHKSIAAFSLCAAMLCGGVLLNSCDETNPNEDGNETTTATYAITLPEASEVYTISADKTTAEEGETVTLTINLTDSINYGITSVTYNNRSCTKENNTTYTFLMPASDVTIAVETTYYEEVTSENTASFRSNMLNKIAKADEAISDFNKDKFYIDFSTSITNPSVTISSSNEDVIPASAVSLYSTTGDGSFVTALQYMIDNASVDIGTCYLTFAISSSNNSYSATLVKKLQVVEYGENVYDEIWTERVIFFIASGVTTTTGGYDNIYFQVSDSNRQYGATVGTVQTESPTDSSYTMTFSYVPYHQYYLSAFYYTDAINKTGTTFLKINEYIGQTGQYSDGYLSFSADDVVLPLSVSLS